MRSAAAGRSISFDCAPGDWAAGVCARGLSSRFWETSGDCANAAPPPISNKTTVEQGRLVFIGELLLGSPPSWTLAIVLAAFCSDCDNEAGLSDVSVSRLISEQLFQLLVVRHA